MLNVDNLETILITLFLLLPPVVLGKCRVKNTRSIIKGNSHNEAPPSQTLLLGRARAEEARS